MKTMQFDPAGEVPFILRFLAPLDRGVYEQSVADHHNKVQTYSPTTQTSTPLMMATGTSRTYTDTFSGLMGSRDDDKPSDT